MGRAARAGGLAAVALAAAVAAPCAADWLQPDVSFREAQLVLRMSARDTTGHADDPGRLDSLGVALMRLARLDEAGRVFRRVVALRPGDGTAEGALGKLALFDDRLAEAESLLAHGDPSDPVVAADLFATRMRRGEFAAAAAMAASANQEGRLPLLERMTQESMYEITGGPPKAMLLWTRAYPVPIVRVKLNGQSVLMAIDTGCADVLLDDAAGRQYRVERLSGQRTEFWTGTRIAVKNAVVQRLELGGIRIERIPAGLLSLRKWSLEVNPQSERVAGVIGLNVLRRFTPTIDYKTQRLELRRSGVAWTPTHDAIRVPFQIWGENELTVYGALAQSRRMAFVVQTGVPGCGVGAPAEVMDEIGVKPGMLSRLAKGAGQWLQGRPWSATVVPTVTVGPVSRDRVPGWLGALDASELWRHGVRRDALLSHDFFRGRRLTIDWKAHELVFED